MPVVVARQEAAGLGRDHRGVAGGGQRGEDAVVGIEGLVATPNQLTPYESKFATRRNPLNDDTP